MSSFIPRYTIQTNAATKLQHVKVNARILNHRCKRFSTAVASPTYVIRNSDNTQIKFQTIPPTFSTYNAPNGRQFLQTKTNGRMLIDFSPVNQATYSGAKLNIALSPEEMGEFLLPSFTQDGIEITRQIRNNDSPTGTKTFTVSPYDDESLEFSLEYEMNHHDENYPEENSSIAVVSDKTTMNVSVEPGEFEVIKCIFKSTISHLVGWDSMMQMQMQNQIQSQVSYNSYNNNNNKRQNTYKNNRNSNISGGTATKDIEF